MIIDINNMPFVGNLRLGRNLYYIEILTLKFNLFKCD